MPLVSSYGTSTVVSPDIERRLLRDFGPKTFYRGLSYWHEGRICQLVDQGDAVLGEVLGSQQRIYNVTVFLDEEFVYSDCSCPVADNCKHGAAVAAAFLAQQTQRDPSSGRINPGTNVWLRELAALADTARSPTADHLVYVVGRPGPDHIDIQAYKVRRLKSGRLSKPQPYDTDGRTGARFLTPEDERILPVLYHSRWATFRVQRLSALPALLQQLAGTDRAYVGTVDGPKLHLGPAARGTFDWHMDGDGQQRLSLRVEGVDDAAVVPTAPPWYIDPRDGRAGPIETPLPDRLASKLLCGPAIGAHEVGAVVEPLSRLGLNVPLPRELQHERLDDIAPVPQLYLGPIAIWPQLSSLRYKIGGREPMGEFSFDYAGIGVSPANRQPTLTHQRGDVVREITRHREAESAAAATLGEHGARILDFSEITFIDLGDADAWVDFVYTSIPELRAAGWRIVVDEDFPYRVVEAEAWYADLDGEQNNQWFDLEIGVEIEGERHSLLPLLVQFLRRYPQAMAPEQLEQADPDTTFMLGLGDGRHVPVPVKRFAPILRTLTELYDPQRSADSERLRLPRVRAAALGELETADAPVRWQGSADVREAGRALLALGETHVAPKPAGLQADLRHYQSEGVGWLQCLADLKLGGVLADDMGLGKTVQVLAHLLLLKEAGKADAPSLVLMPTSLLFNWEREAQRFAPSLRVLRLHGPKRGELSDQIGQADLVLTTYALVHRDIETLAQQRFHLCVLDEAQAVKNPKSRAAQAVRRLKAEQRLCLTGTPLENHLGELWAQFDFLLPGLLGEHAQFSRLFRRPIEKEGDTERRAALRRRIGPFVMRRTKQAVATELPEKTELQRYAELSGPQRDLYETVRTAMHERVRKEVQRKGLARSHIVVLDALLKLRQVCCDPRLVKMDAARKTKGSAKLDLLMELLPGLIEDGRRVLLFSQFTSMLSLIDQALAPTGIDHVQLTGQTQDRETPIRRFQAGEVPLFLISLKAGGTGLNLTAADTVIHYDPWWNPAVMRQATDRAHRIGQTQPVFVYHLIAKDTVEEKIVALQQRKADLGAALLGGAEGHAPAFGMEDVEALFEPIG
ncbi:MAG TPA: DEAD/DEAH box helicase [Gammaproteobacteria bacterium]|nr:DEAD/DEAH box helicase [Gammaproteobacteria bacterium]